MHFLWTLLVGLVVGALARLIMPGKDSHGIFVTMLLGVAGAFLAEFIGEALGWYTADEAPGIVASIIGALILLGGYRAVLTLGKRRRGM